MSNEPMNDPFFLTPFVSIPRTFNDLKTWTPWIGCEKNVNLVTKKIGQNFQYDIVLFQFIQIVDYILDCIFNHFFGSRLFSNRWCPLRRIHNNYFHSLEIGWSRWYSRLVDIVFFCWTNFSFFVMFFIRSDIHFSVSDIYPFPHSQFRISGTGIGCNDRKFSFFRCLVIKLHNLQCDDSLRIVFHFIIGMIVKIFFK